MKCCPIEVALEELGKKWALNILRDLFQGRSRFRDFLHANSELSTKMLSARLKDLEAAGFITKEIVSKSPVTVEYRLTMRGSNLNRVLYELACYSVDNCCERMDTAHPKQRQVYRKELEKTFLMHGL